jgi:FlaA1/EpsC-like NDP-sugar epimerase
MLGEGKVWRQPFGAWRYGLARQATRVRTDVVFAAVDVTIIMGAYTFALAFRMLDPMVGDVRKFWVHLAITLPAIVFIHLAANVVAGAYGHIWEHASTDEARQVVVANAMAGTLILGMGWYVRDAFEIVVPFGVLLIGAFLTLAAMGLVRFRARLFSIRRRSKGTRVLVVGTGRDAATFARQAPTFRAGVQVVGFVADSKPRDNGARRLAGLPILGEVSEISEIVRNQDISEVIVVGSDPQRTRKVVDLCLDVDARLRILPAAEDVLNTRSAARDVRDILVDDLLVRPAVASDLSEVKELLRGKRVLVTGAGGSIGAEVVNQVLGFEPAGLWALDRDETLLHDAGLRWKGSFEVVLCDIRDAVKVLRVFEEIRPEVVFHAAALKHVPVIEYFPEEAVLTNIAGTRNVIEATSRTGVGRFVLISTDKAVNPVSVMGATKRVAEMLVQLGEHRDDGCAYTAVRFGNVLGSRGSVIPTFIDQIKAGGPVTVTDAAMTRYFMTGAEAVELVLQASALASGSEVFFLDMGEPVRIVALARRLIRLAGLSPEKDIPIVYTGIRPGEKLTETLFIGELEETSHPKILKVQSSHLDPVAVIEAVAKLEQAAIEVDRSAIRELLADLATGELGWRDDAAFADDLARSWA